MFLLITFCFLILFSNASDSVQVEIESVKKELSEIKKQNESLQKELWELKSEQIDNHKEIIETREIAINAKNNILTQYFQIFAIIGVIFGFVFAFFSLKFYILKVFNSFLIAEFRKSENLKVLFSEIESNIWKESLRNKNVLVLNNSKTTVNENLKKALKIFNPEYKNIDSLQAGLKLSYSKYSLVILENLDKDGIWDTETFKVDFKSLIDKICNKEIALVYYGKGNLPETENAHLLNYANSPSTLYNNVMNILKYQDLIKKN